MSTNPLWIDELPSPLKENVVSLIQRDPTTIKILEQLYEHLNPSPKRQKVDNSDSSVSFINDYNLKISNKLSEDEIIFEIPMISFQSPIRKKMNLILHLVADNGPVPILSIVNPSTSIPELSLTKLSESVRFCCVLPILGMSTIENKKNIASLCFWLNDSAYVDNKNDPIICQVNLDLLKKHLIKTGKIPPDIESQFQEPAENPGIKLIHEAIFQFLQRQFKLCGINLINYLPLYSNKNTFNINTDNAIALSSKSNTINDMVMVQAYKGSKDGAILVTNKNEFNPSFLIFGFKKPILIFDLDEVDNISYSDITRVTFSLNVKFKSGKTLEFSMIDQNYHNILDDFFKLQGVLDNSYDDSLKEKTDKKSETAGEATVQPTAPAEEEDDEEEDDNYQGGEEEDDEEDVAEEFDSNVEDSGEEGEEDEEEGGEQ